MDVNSVDSTASTPAAPSAPAPTAEALAFDQAMQQAALMQKSVGDMMGIGLDSLVTSARKASNQADMDADPAAADLEED